MLPDSLDSTPKSSTVAALESGGFAMAQTGVINLNNEVVKMRKEVKRTRVLVIRRLTRHLAKLKSKKGTEDILSKNQRRIQRLLEEIHAMKDIKPDEVTKSALDDDINFEKICKKPDSTATERAIARLATYPLLKKKIDALKAAIKAFKDARQTITEVKSLKDSSEENHNEETGAEQSSTDNVNKFKHQESTVKKEENIKMLSKKPTTLEKKMNKMEDKEKAGIPPHMAIKPSQEPSLIALKTQNKEEKNPAVTDKINRTEVSTISSDDGSDVEEQSEGEKEYFDDSTEERFYKQSSLSEDSDSDDDFFIGKVKRTRKKENNGSSSVKEEKTSQKVSPEKEKLEKLESMVMKVRPNTKARKLESTFFSSLSESRRTRRNAREQLPKNRIPAFQQNEPQIKNHLDRSMSTRHENKKQQLQQPLHPSWEASRKRKEQMSKITVFQGKKITFDDD
ncbi:serum response factor-binding protein 1 isoform X2 [Dromiciops gliroides]|uniref:serum response factor-binding protein 1 isoform X2 n=1 Tax=Dromiciops gliroides TaxID=33562 RepID=UPI001CC6C99D|nr:serum response factor-binding protein 1 isoform X2 [Dromiciops gliroides]